ncbi:hypothetical protein, partial [Burkholderia contaminans]|uniref:hypothetical protein n=1 Tax=Burkholderia contaminans TaxID=488447 RepID=UPI000A447752
PERPIGWLTEILAFVLVVLACDGIEALRMWSLKVQLPRARPLRCPTLSPRLKLSFGNAATGPL